MSKTGRKFVGKITNKRVEEQKMQHMRWLAEQALQAATDSYLAEGVKPTPLDMRMYLIMVMMSLELKQPIEDILSTDAPTQEQKEQIQAMSDILILQWQFGQLSIPEQFPYTLDELLAV